MITLSNQNIRDWYENPVTQAIFESWNKKYSSDLRSLPNHPLDANNMVINNLAYVLKGQSMFLNQMNNFETLKRSLVSVNIEE